MIDPITSLHDKEAIKCAPIFHQSLKKKEIDSVFQCIVMLPCLKTHAQNKVMHCIFCYNGLINA